jgi:hypothetical protein
MHGELILMRMGQEQKGEQQEAETEADAAIFPGSGERPQAEGRWR